MNKKNIYNKKSTMKYAGAFIAWVIGSGFATGQEILQFFTSYGYFSYAIIFFNLIGFIYLGQVLVSVGFLHKDKKYFNHFKYFCGEKLGEFYSWLIPVTLILLMSVLISGAGATLKEYYGINHIVGTAFMGVMVLNIYFIGFERFIKIVSSIGPVIIIFSLLVGILTIIFDIGNYKNISEYEIILENSKAAPNWIVSSLLYLSLNFLTGSFYFTKLGQSARSLQEVRYGALIGSIALILSVFIMNTAILLNAKNTVFLEIPVLYLAKEISYLFGGIFSIVLILGIFSSCSAMMWSVCSRFTVGGSKGNKLFAVAVSVFTIFLGLFPFNDLISIFYPLIGYLGFIFIILLIYKGKKFFNYKTLESRIE